MQDKPWTKYWIKKFQMDVNFGNKRLKRLENGYPPFEIDDNLIDTVDLKSFITDEEDRIPLFIASQFGIHPSIKSIPDFFNGPKMIAVLSKSLLSGNVHGLSIHLIQENDKASKSNVIAKFLN